MEKLLDYISTKAGDSPAAKDLKLNFGRLLQEGQLEPKLAALAFYASFEAVNATALLKSDAFDGVLSGEEKADAKDAAGIMGMLNVYYRFKHYVGDENYKVAALRMNSLGKPNLGKETFEALAFTVSAINGCEYCVKSHEKVLLQHGFSHDKIHDLARIGAVAKGLEVLLRE